MKPIASFRFRPSSSSPGPALPVAGLALAGIATVALAFALGSDRWLEASRREAFAPDHHVAHAWGPAHEVQLGLRGMTLCFDAPPCSRLSLDELPGGWRTELTLEHAFGGGPREPERAQAIVAAGADYLIDWIERAAVISRDAAARRVAAMFAWSPAFTPFARVTQTALAIAMIALSLTIGLIVAGVRVRLPIAPTTITVVAVGIALISGCVLVAVHPGPPGYLGVGPGFAILGVAILTSLFAAMRLARWTQPLDGEWDEPLIDTD